MTDHAQIEVSASPLPDQIWAAVRQIAPAVTAFALGRHFISGDTATLLALVGGVAWPIVAGQLKTRRRAQQLADIANNASVPDEIITIRKAA